VDWARAGVSVSCIVGDVWWMDWARARYRVSCIVADVWLTGLGLGYQVSCIVWLAGFGVSEV